MPTRHIKSFENFIGELRKRQPLQIGVEPTTIGWRMGDYPSGISFHGIAYGVTTPKRPLRYDERLFRDLNLKRSFGANIIESIYNDVAAAGAGPERTRRFYLQTVMLAEQRADQLQLELPNTIVYLAADGLGKAFDSTLLNHIHSEARERQITAPAFLLDPR